MRMFVTAASVSAIVLALTLTCVFSIDPHLPQLHGRIAAFVICYFLGTGWMLSLLRRVQRRQQTVLNHSAEASPNVPEAAVVHEAGMQQAGIPVAVVTGPPLPPSARALSTNQPQVPGSAFIVDGLLQRQTAWAMTKVHLEKIRTVDVVVRSMGKQGLTRYVECSGDGTVQLPLEDAGKDAVLPVLSERPGFDHEALRRGQESTTESRTPLWRAPLQLNTTVSKQSLEEAQSEFRKGPVLLSRADQEELQLTWDITYAELLLLPGVTSTPNNLRGRDIRLGPVRLCGLICQSVRVYQTFARSNVPVKDWNADITLTPVWDDQYRVTKEAIERVLGATTPSQSGSLQGSWTQEEMRVWLLGSRRTISSAESERCTLSVGNGRPYPQFLTDPYMESFTLDKPGLQARAYAISREGIGTDFRSSRWIRRTPEAIEAWLNDGTGHTWAVWSDQTAGVCGFATVQGAVVVPRVEIAKLQVLNSVPERAAERADLSLIDFAGDSVRVGSAGYHDFDTLLGELATLIGVSIEIQPDWIEG